MLDAERQRVVERREAGWRPFQKRRVNAGIVLAVFGSLATNCGGASMTAAISTSSPLGRTARSGTFLTATTGASSAVRTGATRLGASSSGI